MVATYISYQGCNGISVDYDIGNIILFLGG